MFYHVFLFIYRGYNPINSWKNPPTLPDFLPFKVNCFTDRQDFADRIATLPALTAKHKVIADAQHENAVDCILEKSWDTFLGVVEGGIYHPENCGNISGKKTGECLFDVLFFFWGELFWKKNSRGVEGVVACSPVYQKRDFFGENCYPR